MKKNLYLAKGGVQRSNPFKLFFYSLFSGVVAIPTIFIEVFTRTCFGRRYFSISMALVMAFFLALFPVVKYYIASLSFYNDNSVTNFLSHYLTWYVFITYFVYTCFQREKEIPRVKGEFDFNRYTLSHGNLDRRLLDFKYQGKGFNIRTVETIIEPALFFLVGLGLAILGQRIGVFLIVTSLCYSAYYHYCYKCGDDFILDIIDNKIANEQTVSVFVDHKDVKDTKGYHMYCGTPSDPEYARQIADTIIEGEPPVYAI